MTGKKGKSGRKPKPSRFAKLLETIPVNTTAMVSGLRVNVLVGLPRTYRIETISFQRVKQTYLLADALQGARMKKFAVYYKSRLFGDTFVHVFAVTASEAIKTVNENGIGYDGGTVYADKVIGCAEVM